MSFSRMRLCGTANSPAATTPEGVAVDLFDNTLWVLDDTTERVYNTQKDAPGPAYFRCTPYFKAPAGKHDWLNRTVIVGGGVRHEDPDHTIFRYYTVE